MFNTIVTGASGLVGAHLLVQLVKNNVYTIATKQENSNIQLVEDLFDWYKISHNDYKKYVQWKVVDIKDIEALDELIQPNFDVYHCAAMVSFIEADKDAMFETNITGTANVVEVCLQKKIRKLCYVSSVATLSINKGETTLHENSYWKNIGNETNYAISKQQAEMHVWRGIEEGLHAVIVNPTVIIGPHNFASGSAKMIETSAKGLKFYTNGVTGFVSANDVAKCLILLMKSNIESERFVLNSENMPYKLFFETSAKYLNVKAPSILVTPLLAALAWRVEKLRCLFSNQKPFITKETANASLQQRNYLSYKIEKTLNFSFENMETVIENTCKYYLKK